MNREKSQQLYSEALQYFPGGVNSPVRAFRSVGGTPIFAARGNGSRLYDADGNEFIDFCCSWGPLILGHNPQPVREAIVATVEHGTSFGMPTELENHLAKLILSNHRYIEKIRFVSSGTEAVMSALRLARGATGKSKILKLDGCYHGHVDSLLVNAGSGLVTFGVSSSAGIPPEFAAATLVAPLNNLAAIEKTFQENSDIAALIIEPIPANNGLLLQSRDYLQGLRQLCTQYGVLLIFDEVISGFRVGFEGAAGYYDIQPDIITFGKIIGGGMPVGAYAANKALMSHIAPDGAVYQAGTLSGNPVAMAAGKAALLQCLQSDFYAQLADKTKRFCQIIQQYADDKQYPVKIFQIGSIFWIAFTKQTSISAASDIDPNSMRYFKQLHAFLLENGIYFGPSGYEVGFVSAAHSETDLAQAAATICAGFHEIAF
jgi:glutamate-1-semialdehyde 2,1-aminomutase